MPRRLPVEDIPQLEVLLRARPRVLPIDTRRVFVSQHFDMTAGWKSRLRAQTKGQKRCMEAFVEKWGEPDPSHVEYVTTFLDEWLTVEMAVYPSVY